MSAHLSSLCAACRKGGAVAGEAEEE